MPRDARSCRRPATAPTPRWRGLPPTSPRSRVAGPCSGSSATRACSTPRWIEMSPTVPGTPPARPRPIGASSSPPCVTGRWPMRASSSVRWPMAASVAWPTYGLDPAIPVSTDDVPHVADIMARHGRAAQPIDLQGGPVRIGPLSDFPGISACLFRALSGAFVIAIIFWTVTAVRRRRPGFSTRAGIVIVMWAASIMTAAGVHTLDVTRYLVPAVPMVGIMLSLFAVELAETIAYPRPRGSRLGPFLNFIFAFCGSGVVYPYGRERSFAAFNAGERDESAMRPVPIVAIMFLGIAAAQGQTMSQTNGQASSSGSAAGSDPLGVATSSLSSASPLLSAPSPSSASQFGASSVSGSDERIGGASHGDNKRRIGDVSIAFAAAGGNTGHVHTDGEHDRGGSEFSFTRLSASGSLNGRRFGQPERDSRRVAWWMLRLDAMCRERTHAVQRRPTKEISPCLSLDLSARFPWR